MLRTKSLITELKEIPREWVFEYYLNLTEKLTGQDIKLKSPFNTTDKIPSAYVYFSHSAGQYRFKDFSASENGDGITLVQKLKKLTSRAEAAYKIITDYNQFILNNGQEDYKLREFKIQQRYKVIESTERSWTNLDQKFWTEFHIGSKLLEHYNIRPLSSYKMIKEENGDLKELLIQGNNHIYGYFRKDGTLYKIYQPLVKNNKFVKIRDYIQGTDQLTYDKKYLVICSSLKDVMAFMKLGYKEAEAIAPDSENTLIANHVIASHKLRYKSICLLFDNDGPGISAAEKYKNKYGLNNVLLPLSKDLSDSMRDNTLQKVKEILTPLLKNALNNK